MQSLSANTLDDATPEQNPTGLTIVTKDLHQSLSNRLPPSVESSPLSDSSTLALEDEAINDILCVDKSFISEDVQTSRGSLTVRFAPEVDIFEFSALPPDWSLIYGREDDNETISEQDDGTTSEQDDDNTTCEQENDDMTTEQDDDDTSSEQSDTITTIRRRRPDTPRPPPHLLLDSSPLSDDPLEIEEEDVDGILNADSTPTHCGDIRLASPAPAHRDLLPLHRAQDAELARERLLQREANLNPRAPTFVPSTPLYLPEPSFSSISWYKPFCDGVRIAARSYDMYGAFAVVAAGIWNVDNITALAQHFCWKGSEAEHTGLAMFAHRVYLQFRSVLGEETANSFMMHLRQCVTGTFEVCWTAAHPQSPLKTPQRSPQQIHSAINLAGFIGELFAAKMLGPRPLYSCWALLLAHLTTAEHIDALRALVTAAGKPLWCDAAAGGARGAGDAAISAFVNTFAVRATGLPDGASVLGRRVTKDDLHRAVAELVGVVRRFRSDIDEMGVQKPVEMELGGSRLWAFSAP